MSRLRHALADYLTMRRALGYKMDKAERLLGRVCRLRQRIAAKPMSEPRRRWPGRPNPWELPRSGHPGVWPRFVSSPGTCVPLTG